jgi:hypothetical protein
MPEEIVRIASKPGVKRDGTRFEGDNYVDACWTRFQRGLPRKIGGYRSINKYLRGLVRSLTEYTSNGLTYVHAGSSAMLERFYIDSNSNTSLITDRTPSGLDASDYNMWSFSVDHDTDGTLLLLAQVAPNLQYISNNTGGQLFYGDLFGTSALTELTVGGTELPTGVSLTGGVVALHPYTFIYGDAGYVAWSVAGDPKDYVSAGSGSANITSQKIVAALPLRGGPGSSPSGLFWSLDSLLRASFSGGDTIFQFDTISSQSSIREKTGYDTPLYEGGRSAGTYSAVFRKPLMSGVEPRNYIATAVEVDDAGTGYTAGDVLTATGGDTIVPVELTVDTVGGTGDITAVTLTNAGSARTPPNGPVTVTGGSGADATITITYVQPYSFWVHETGVNAVDGMSQRPIKSCFETAEISLPAQKQVNRALQVLMMEPDFVQSGDLTVQVRGRANARAPEVDDEVKTIVETPSTPEEQVVYFKTQRRELRFYFESNVIDGDYQMGLTMVHLQPGDGTVIG